MFVLKITLRVFEVDGKKTSICRFCANCAYNGNTRNVGPFKLFDCKEEELGVENKIELNQFESIFDYLC